MKTPSRSAQLVRLAQVRLDRARAEALAREQALAACREAVRRQQQVVQEADRRRRACAERLPNRACPRFSPAALPGHRVVLEQLGERVAQETGVLRGHEQAQQQAQEALDAARLQVQQLAARLDALGELDTRRTKVERQLRAARLEALDEEEGQAASAGRARALPRPAGPTA